MTYSSAVALPATIAPALIDRYSTPRPHYTSYPTAPHFDAGFDSLAYVNAHRRSMHRRAPLGLHLHLPFCRSLCTYRAYPHKITKSRDTIATYVQYLARELALVGRSVGRPVGRIHWGGGMPTYLSQAAVRRLMHTVRQHFDVLPSAQLNIEVAPRGLSRSYLDTLVDVGFRRISLGVQAFAPQVQRAIGQGQPVEVVARVVADARAAGMAQLNFDLLYAAIDNEEPAPPSREQASRPAGAGAPLLGHRPRAASTRICADRDGPLRTPRPSPG
ncbi:MAG: radical SAM protein [Bacteroidetes bacterium]|nr:radical SAM protein [Bacteroidota bacterium]